MSLYYDSKKETFRAACCVSRGALSLVSGAFGYTALFEHASKAATVLGNRNLKETADGIFESVPVYTIPTEDMLEACQKLLQVSSIALVECMFDEKKNSSRFVLVWFIHCKPDAPKPPSKNLDDY